MRTTLSLADFSRARTVATAVINSALGHSRASAEATGRIAERPNRKWFQRQMVRDAQRGKT